MLKIKLVEHDFRYEIFQIASLFFDKSEIEFKDDGDCDFESILDREKGIAVFRDLKDKEKNSWTVKVDLESKKSIKNGLKLTALKGLEEYKDIKMPWGILVGIRPTKIVHECFKDGMKDREIMDYLMDNYSLRENKAALTLEVAKNESRFLGKRENSVGVYIGIPFCPTRCSYCSFTSNPIGANKGLVEDYLTALQREIEETVSYMKSKSISIDTLYIGGGTPTSLSLEQLRKLLSTVEKTIDTRSLREYTIEAGRPDSIDEGKLRAIKESGCTRISINPQTMNDETLKRIGRLHSSQDIIDKFKLAREVGFNNINMDIIIGLPGEGINEVERTMEVLKGLGPESITIHTMAIKRASRLNEEDYSRFNSEAEKMYDEAVEAVRGMGMYPYYMYRQKNMVSPLENIGYCSEGRECIYNIQMIAENISIIAMGADAVSKLVFEDENRIERVANVKDIREYVNRIEEMINKKIDAVSMLTK